MTDAVKAKPAPEWWEVKDTRGERVLVLADNWEMCTSLKFWLDGKVVAVFGLPTIVHFLRRDAESRGPFIDFLAGCQAIYGWMKRKRKQSRDVRVRITGHWPPMPRPAPPPPEAT